MHILKKVFVNSDKVKVAATAKTYVYWLLKENMRGGMCHILYTRYAKDGNNYCLENWNFLLVQKKNYKNVTYVNPGDFQCLINGAGLRETGSQSKQY